MLPQIDLDNIVNVNNHHHPDNSEKIFRFGQKYNPSFFRLLSTDYKHKLRVVVKKTLTRLKSIIVSVLSKQSYRIQRSIRGNLEVIARNWSYLLAFSISQLNALQSFLYRGKGAKWHLLDSVGGISELDPNAIKKRNPMTTAWTSWKMRISMAWLAHSVRFFLLEQPMKK